MILFKSTPCNRPIEFTGKDFVNIMWGRDASVIHWNGSAWYHGSGRPVTDWPHISVLTPVTPDPVTREAVENFAKIIITSYDETGGPADAFIQPISVIIDEFVAILTPVTPGYGAEAACPYIDPNSSYRKEWISAYNEGFASLQSLLSEAKDKCAADHLSIDELQSEFKRQGIDTTNWDGEQGAEKAIVDGVVYLLTEAKQEKERLKQDLYDYGEWARGNGERFRGNLQKSRQQLYEQYLKEKETWKNVR